jgi:hypothetical protein
MQFYHFILGLLSLPAPTDWSAILSSNTASIRATVVIGTGEIKVPTLSQRNAKRMGNARLLITCSDRNVHPRGLGGSYGNRGQTGN